MRTVRILLAICLVALVGGAVAGISGDILKYLLVPLLALIELQVIDWSYGAPKKSPASAGSEMKSNAV